MPRLTDLDHIRSILNTDHVWAAYALGDLAPGFYEQTHWHYQPEDPAAIVMILHGFGLPVLFMMGPTASVFRLLSEIELPSHVFYLAYPELRSVLQEFYHIEKTDTMLRMHLQPGDFRFTASQAVERLKTSDVEALQTLYADGNVADEAPDFFLPGMLDHGVYFGVREGEQLVAAAGTHLCEASEGVGAIGNVYTRRDRRGRGLATQVTGAVAAELIRQQLPTIVLNVKTKNLAAKKVYERLGFLPHCIFQEGTAVLTAPEP